MNFYTNGGTLCYLLPLLSPWLTLSSGRSPNISTFQQPHRISFYVFAVIYLSSLLLTDIWLQNCVIIRGFPGGSDGKASAYNAGDPGLIPGSGRSPGEGNGNPLQYSCLENSMDREAWWATVHGVTKSQTRLSDFTFTSSCAIINYLVVTIVFHKSVCATI